MQADRRLVEDEERVDERGAQRRGQIDALDFAPGQGARLAIEREITEAHLRQVAEPCADLGEEQIGGVVERLRQVHMRQEIARAIDGQQHQIVHGQSRQARERGVVELDPARTKAQARRQHAFAVLVRSEAPQQGIGLEPRAAADLARRVGAILRQQHPDVHLVGFGLEPGEEAPHAVPDPRPRAAPAHPFGLAFQYPSTLRVVEVAPRHVERNAALFRIFDQVVLALGKARALPGSDRAGAKRLRRVGNDKPIVQTDHAAEAAAFLAGAERRVERKEARRRVAVVNIAIGAVQVGREAPDRRALGRLAGGARCSRRGLVGNDMHVDAPLPHP